MLRKTKIVLLFGSLIILVVIISILIIRAVKPKTTTPQTISIIPEGQTTSTTILTQSSTESAIAAKKILLPKLPIEINNFNTSVGINTDILISSYNNDSPDVVRIEVFGIDYLPNHNDPSTNPNMVAFKESFEKAISTLQEDGVSIKNLHIQLSNREYIRSVAEGWINILNLLP